MNIKLENTPNDRIWHIEMTEMEVVNHLMKVFIASGIPNPRHQLMALIATGIPEARVMAPEEMAILDVVIETLIRINPLTGMMIDTLRKAGKPEFLKTEEKKN